MTDTNNNNNEKNWSLICCLVFATGLMGYVGISSRITTLTEQYRNELLVAYMNQNEKLRLEDCERPIAQAESDATARGRKIMVDDKVDMLDTKAKAKCLNSRKLIADNEEKAKKLVITPAPTNYLTNHFFK